MKIHVYLASQGVLSRREAERQLKDGHIFVNDERITDPTHEMKEGDAITFSNTLQRKIRDHITLAFYKPRGIVSDKHDGQKDILGTLPKKYRDLHVVGRLDKESEGLILVTNDGRITKRLTNEHKTEKEYIVTTHEKINPGLLPHMEKPIKIDNKMTLPAKVTYLDKNTLSVILKDGRNHQVRRLANRSKLTVKALKRVRIGKLGIKRLQSGQYRILKPEEIQTLFKN